MSENFESHINRPEESEVSVVDILARLDAISNEDRQAFREKIDPYTISIFDNAPHDVQDIYVLLDSCSDDEIKYLIDRQKNSGTLLAIHDINQYLTVLVNLVPDGRIKNIIRQLSKDKQ